MLDKRRGKAYREILAGCQYHGDEKLSRIDFGFKRGSVIDCRTVLGQISTWIKREFGFRIDYFRVENWEQKGGEWRVHVHMIWNAPYIKQQRIREKVEEYIGENANVYIQLMDGDKRAARYMMQYVGYQEGKCYYTKSRGWLPEGYNDEFQALKKDYWKKIPNLRKKGIKDDDALVNLMSRYDDTWRKEVLVNSMVEWVEKARVKRNYDHEEGMAQKYSDGV
jgi:hypothetical protein